MSGGVSIEAEDGPEPSSRGAGWGWVVWPAVVLVLYVLSTGPVLWMFNRKIVPRGGTVRMAQIVYSPIEWANGAKALGKPLRMYWHFWAPEVFDSKGNVK